MNLETICARNNVTNLPVEIQADANGVLQVNNINGSLPAGSNVIGGVTLPAASAPVYGQQTSTGTATALAANTLTSGIVLTNIGTTNAIWVGGSGLTTSNGYSLAVGASVGLVVSNTGSIYILQNTGASTLSFIGS